MPHPFDLNSTVSSMEELSSLVSRFVTEFETGLSLKHPLNVDLLLHQRRSGLADKHIDPSRPVVVTEQDGAETVLHLHESDLVGMPVSALQGGLYLELAAVVLGRQIEEFQFNFEKEILPLFNISGTALQVIRYLVFHLETIVKRVRAAQLVLDMDHGPPLCSYYYFTTSPSREESDSYEKLVPHDWTRAIFISKKCRMHAAITLLARQGIFAGLDVYWWACHDYFLPEDRRLMEELAEIAARFNQIGFSEQVVALFKTVKSALLV
ncbi:MAG: hypothetical protein LJE96_19920 [Deltaproteobacteria bacterium]|nr:hypothetical protein [Deltaproteobacteria bacterium]